MRLYLCLLSLPRWTLILLFNSALLLSLGMLVALCEVAWTAVLGLPVSKESGPSAIVLSHKGQGYLLQKAECCFLLGLAPD